MKVRIVICSCLLLALAVPLCSSTCITASCHTEFRRLKKLHFPVEDNCHRCHEVKGDPELHQFSLLDQTAVCFQCHDENRNRKYVHEAISSSDCAACHNAHGGNYQAYLKTERIDTLCFECHDKAPMSKKEVHTPLRQGDCTACHRAHASDYPVLLIAGKEGFCLRCHEDKNYAGKNMKVHSILAEGCSQCHDPHSSDYLFQLSASPGRICGECHDDIAEKARTAKFPHAILEQEKQCLNCHEPHAALVEFNLKKREIDLCVGCHNTPLDKGSGRRGYNIHRVLQENSHLHGPLENGECSPCHDPHGSGFSRILSAAYPPGFYREFTVDGYELCFRCHDQALVTEQETDRATGFREGRRNLHYLHVNRKKGRSCRACHEAHASPQEKLIRRVTPFGQWEIPMNFRITASGGSCSPGCHVPFAYHRQKK